MINFLHVVLNGYANERKYFLDYLLREQKKAEAEHYQAEEFFSKCFDVVEGLKKDLDRQLFERKRELYLMLSEAKNGTINFGQESELSYKERCKETQDYCEKELKEISKHNFTVLLHSYTNTAFTGHLHFDHVLEIETKISNAIEAYNSEIDLEEVLKKYKRTPEANLIPPYRLLFFKFDNWDKFLSFLKASTPRYFFVLANLPPEDQIRLKNDFCDYLKEINEAQTESKYKEYLDNYIKLIEEKYQEIKKEVPLYNPEDKRQLYLKSKDAKVIFPYLQPEWKFNDWKKFLWFFEVTRPTYIYIFDRLEYNEQLQLKWDFIDLLQVIKGKQTETKYIKALQSFEAYINNFAGTIGKDKGKIEAIEQPEQPEIPDSKNLHSHIFNNNAFEVWKSMFDAFNITERNRSHVKFMFEEMRKDGLIYKTVTQKHFLDWVSETYNIAVGKTNNYSKTDERISIYSTAKQRYNSKDTTRT